jgi:hypothetical protein
LSANGRPSLVAVALVVLVLLPEGVPAGAAAAERAGREVLVRQAGVGNAQILALRPASGSSIAHRASASAGASSGNLTINKPSGTAENDVLVATVGIRPSSATITPASGWTLVRRTSNSSTTSNSLATYTKVAGTRAPANYTWTFSTSTGSAGGISAYTGVDTTSPVLEKAGLPPIRFHDLRHTAATLLLGQGVHPKIVSEMLGHSTVNITLDLYSHVTPTMQRAAVNALDSLLRP